VLKGLIRKLRRQIDSPTPPSKDEWERLRLQHVGRVSDETSRIQGILRGSSWLATVCCAESVDPNSLGLSSERCESLCEELARLQTVKPLELYVACLEKLTGADNCHSQEEGC
jgi:hypothetical protein